MENRADASRRLAKPGWDHPAFGLMLRHDWCEELVSRLGELPFHFIETYPENYARRGGRQLDQLATLAEQFPMTCHGVHLNLGGTDALNDEYLTTVRGFLKDHDALWFSDHPGATVHGGEILHEILPVPANRETCAHMAARIRETRDRIERPFLFENICGYFVPPGTTYSEIEFVTELLEQSDGEMLFDVNNLYVNSQNHGFSALDYLKKLDPKRVREIHIGGFTIERHIGLLIDSHAAAPAPPVWRLLEEALVHLGPKPVLVEWESHFDSLDGVLSQFSQVEGAWRRAAERSKL